MNIFKALLLNITCLKYYNALILTAFEIGSQVFFNVLFVFVSWKVYYQHNITLHTSTEYLSQTGDQTAAQIYLIFSGGSPLKYLRFSGAIFGNFIMQFEFSCRGITLLRAYRWKTWCFYFNQYIKYKSRGRIWLWIRFLNYLLEQINSNM